MGHRQQSSWFHGKDCYTLLITPDLLPRDAPFALITENWLGATLSQRNFHYHCEVMVQLKVSLPSWEVISAVKVELLSEFQRKVGVFLVLAIPVVPSYAITV